MSDLAPVYKAVAAGVVTAVVAELARYGFRPGPDVVTALGVVTTAIVGYVAGHVVVYFSPANKVK